jgi:hypothetical protein
MFINVVGPERERESERKGGREREIVINRSA